MAEPGATSCAIVRRHAALVIATAGRRSRRGSWLSERCGAWAGDAGEMWWWWRASMGRTKAARCGGRVLRAYPGIPAVVGRTRSCASPGYAGVAAGGRVARGKVWTGRQRNWPRSGSWYTSTRCTVSTVSGAWLGRTVRRSCEVTTPLSWWSRA